VEKFYPCFKDPVELFVFITIAKEFFMEVNYKGGVSVNIYLVKCYSCYIK